MDRGLRLSLLIAGVGGLILRIWVLAGPLGELDGDEAVTALMAERLLDFEVSTFYWGQAYGGSLDSMLTAPVLAVTGPSVWAVKLVMIVMHAVACAVVWRIGRRLCGERSGLVSAAIAWVFSPAVVWWSTKSRGFYGSGLVLSMLTILLVVRLVGRQPDEDRRRDRDDLLAIGFITGLAWWTTPIAFFAIGPAVLVGLVQRRDLWRRLPLTVVPFIAGGLPWWLFNVSNGFPSLDAPADAATSYAERVDRLITVMIPMLTGLRQPFSARWTLGWLVGALVLVGVLYAAWRMRRSRWVLLVVLVLYPFVAAVSATSEYVGEPRYGYFLAPVIALVVGGALSAFDRAMVAAPVVLLLLTTLGTIALSDLGEERRLINYDLAPPPTEELVAELDGRGIDHLYAEYWLAYRLTFETDIVANPGEGSRDREIARAVDSLDNPPLAFYRDSAALARLIAVFGHEPFEFVELDDYVIVFRVDVD